MFLENHKSRIHIVDSKSAAAGETLVAIKLREYIDANYSFEEISEKIDVFVSNMKTLFILDEYDNLVKNGRMKQLAGAFIKALSIKPIMGAEDGAIKLFGKGRGYQKGSSKSCKTRRRAEKGFKRKYSCNCSLQCERKSHEFQKDD